MRFFTMLFGLWFWAAAVAAAQDATTSGTVRNSDAAIGQARIDFLRDNVVIVSTTTDDRGHYTATVPPGNYSLRITPTASPDLKAETIDGVSITGSTATFDVTLLSPGREIRGIVRGSGGVPLPNVMVEARSKSNRVVGRARTGPDGRYSLITREVASLLFGGSGHPNAPMSWSASTDTSDVSSPSVDVNLPVVALSGTVRGLSDETFPAAISVQSSEDSLAMRFTAEGNSNTTPDGRFSVITLAGNAAVNVFPLDTTRQTAFSQLLLNLDKDTVRDLKAPSPRAVRGVVRGIQGTPLPNVNVYAYSRVGERLLAQTKTDADGRYVVSVNGTVDLRFTGSGSTFAPPVWSLKRRNVDPVLDFSVDIDLPVVKVSGAIKGADGSPIPGASVVATTHTVDATTRTESDSSLDSKSGTDGTFSGLLLKGSLETTVRPPANSRIPSVSRAVSDVTADHMEEFVLGLGNTIVGTVYGLGRNPVVGADVTVISTADGQVFSQTKTNEKGQYTVSAAGIVSLRLGASFPMQKPPPHTPLSWTYTVHKIDASTNNTVDAVLPVVELRGTVTNSAGQPLSTGYVSAQVLSAKESVSGPELFSSGSVQAKADGSFSLLIFKGNGQFSAEVPSEPAYPRASFPNEFQTASVHHIRLQNGTSSK